MHHMKHLLARWLCARAEATARATRRELRDHARRELSRADAADRRARGLRIYAAWVAKDCAAGMPHLSTQAACAPNCAWPNLWTTTTK